MRIQLIANRVVLGGGEWVGVWIARIGQFSKQIGTIVLINHVDRAELLNQSGSDIGTSMMHDCLTPFGE
jgi:hypothetical protein